MNNYSKNFEVIWADMDPNRHMRHTAYNDYAAQVRVSFMVDNGLSLEEMEKLQLGPVLFKEETVFLSEIRMGEKIKVDIQIAGLSNDGDRWKMVHHIYKSNGKLSAIITVEGAWIDMTQRKLKAPPAKLSANFNELPKTKDYQEIIKGK
ncbi:MAG: thioesterase family protein [Bacteroidales bacterium]|nr:thioesterase family protein [Bacteroidales bacterium]